MMRQVVVDTETTGLESEQGERIIEIGCIEIKNRRRTEQQFQSYLNPEERPVQKGAFVVHGLSNEFLADKPVFADVAGQFVDFIRDSEVIIHNAPFDIAFFNSEFKRLGKKWGKIEDYCRVTDTLAIARRKHPGQKNNLDALCERYAVDNTHRELHGALLDAQILADVYLAMTGGQTALLLSESIPAYARKKIDNPLDPDRDPLPIIEASEQELRAHQKSLELIQKQSGGNCIWLNKVSSL